MGFDYENKRFTPENAEVLPAQTEKMVHELEPGDIRYIPSELVWVERADRRIWINGNAAVYEAEDLYEMGEFGDESDFARLICIEEGLIVDFSHLEQYDWSSLDNRWERSGGVTKDELFEGTVKRLPVIYLVSNPDELDLITPVLEQQYSLVLDGTELGPILQGINGALSDIDEEDMDDDYEDSGEDDGEAFDSNGDDEDLAA